MAAVADPAAAAAVDRDAAVVAEQEVALMASASAVASKPSASVSREGEMPFLYAVAVRMNAQFIQHK